MDGLAIHAMTVATGMSPEPGVTGSVLDYTVKNSIADRAVKKCDASEVARCGSEAAIAPALARPSRNRAPVIPHWAGSPAVDRATDRTPVSEPLD